MEEKNELEKAIEFGYQVGQLGLNRVTTLNLLEIASRDNVLDKKKAVGIARMAVEDFEDNARTLVKLADEEYSGTEISRLAKECAPRYSAEIKEWAEFYLNR